MSASGSDTRVGGDAFILGIAGSPRRGGNTDKMLEAALRGASAEGFATRTLVVALADIGWCRECGGCSSGGECVRSDGMTAVYPLLDQAAGLVVATPTFFATVPAVLKALLDRCQPYWARRYLLGEPPAPKRPAGLLIAAGGGGPGGVECVETPVRSALTVAGFSFVETIVAEVDEPDDILAVPDVLDACLRLGGEIGRRAATAI